MTATPVPDAAGRTVSHIVYHITIRTVITADNSGFVSTDIPMASCRKMLTAYGGEFHYQNNGFGDLIINTPASHAAGVLTASGLVAGVSATGAATGASPTDGTVQGLFNTTTNVRDVVWGPKPRVLRWVPLGAGQACELTWTVDVAIPECDNATFDGAKNWMEFNFGVDYNVDKSGYTTRTYSGYLRVPQTRASQSTRTIRYTADESRELIYPSLVPGFHRTPGNYNLSLDKCRLDFSGIRDEEMGPNYPPPGFLSIQASHTMTSDTFYSAMWRGTFTATYELSRNVGRDAALGHFLTLFADRLVPAIQAPNLGGGFAAAIGNFLNKEQGNGITAHPILKGIQVSEPEIYGRKGAAFTASYTVGMPITSLVKNSGLWMPVTKNDPKAWTNSFNGKDWGPRGNAGLRFRAADDSIIDLCLPPRRTQLSSGRGDLTAGQGRGGPTLKAGPPPGRFPPPLEGKRRKIPTSPVHEAGHNDSTLPDDDPSWLRWFSWLEYSEVDEIVELKPLPRVRVLIKLANSQTIWQNVDPQGPPEPIFQKRCGRSNRVNFKGFALRAGKQIPRPRLLSVGKPPVNVIPANREGEGFQSGIMAQWFGTTIYYASWDLRYVMGKTEAGFDPNQQQLPANPFVEPRRRGG